MSLKKRLTAVAVVAAMAAAVLYGSTLEMSGADEEASRLSWFDRKETIHLWYADENLTDYLNSAAVSFGEREGVRVLPVLASDSEYLEAVNRESLHGEQAPDVYLISNDALEKAYLAGLASEVKDTANICNSEHFPDAALSAASYKGKVIAYPLFFETSALVYNKTYLDEWAKQQTDAAAENADEADGSVDGADAGATDGNVGAADGQAVDGSAGTADGQAVDGSANAADGQVADGSADATDGQATEAELQNGTPAQIPATVDDILSIANTFDVPEGVEGVLKWDVSDIFYNYWIVGQYMVVGGDAGDNESNININNPETIQCLDVYKSLNQFFSIESDKVTYESVVQDFIDGKTVFTIGTTDVVKRLEDAKADGSFAYEYGIAPMPDVSADLKSRSMSVTNVAVVNGYSQHKDLANRFCAYLADEYTDNLYQYTGKVSANKKANLDNAALQAFATEYAESIPLPKMMETGNFWLQLEVLFSKVWNGADVTTAVQELADQMASQTQGAQ